MRDSLFAVNLSAGSGRAGEVWRRLAAAHPELNGAGVILEADLEKARERLRAALRPGLGAVVAVGGDGTVHQVANVLLEAGLGGEIPLGIVPAGTGSDLAAALGIPADPEAALQLALEATPRPCDALEALPEGHSRRFVVNVASAGVSGMVAQRVNSLSRRNAFTYFTAALGAVLRFHPPVCRVTLDGEEWYQGPLLLLAVANSYRFGRAMKVAPGALLDDGLADVVLIPGMPRWRLPLRLPRVYLGRHLGLPGVQSRRATTVRLEPLEPGLPPWELDGESGPACGAELRLLPGALRVLAPPP